MHILRMFLTAVEIIVCLMLIGLVLIQKSKGDGLNAAIGGGVGESLFGANVGNIVTRTTVILGLVFLINTILLGLIMTISRGASRSVVEDTPMPPPPASAPSVPGMPSSGSSPAPFVPPSR